MLTRLPMSVAIAVFFAVLFSIVVGVGSASFPKVSAAAPTGLLVVENQFDHALLLVDPVAKPEIARVVVDVNGHEVTLPKDGRLAYVPIYGNVAIGESPARTATRLTLLICRRADSLGAWIWVSRCGLTAPSWGLTDCSM
jgi:hypothetical protein